MYGATLRIYGGRCATNQIDPDQVTVAELVEYLLEKHNWRLLNWQQTPLLPHSTCGTYLQGNISVCNFYGKKRRNTLMEMKVFYGKTSVYNESIFTCIIDLNIRLVPGCQGLHKMRRKCLSIKGMHTKLDTTRSQAASVGCNMSMKISLCISQKEALP